MKKLSDLTSIKKLSIKELFKVKGGVTVKPKCDQYACTIYACLNYACLTYTCDTHACQQNSCLTMMS